MTRKRDETRCPRCKHPYDEHTIGIRRIKRRNATRKNAARLKAAGLPWGKRRRVDISVLCHLNNEGLTPRQIAERMGFSPVTIRWHLRRIKNVSQNSTKNGKPISEPEIVLY